MALYAFYKRTAEDISMDLSSLETMNRLLGGTTRWTILPDV